MALFVPRAIRHFTKNANTHPITLRLARIIGIEKFYITRSSSTAGKAKKMLVQILSELSTFDGRHASPKVERSTTVPATSESQNREQGKVGTKSVFLRYPNNIYDTYELSKPPFERVSRDSHLSMRA